MKVISVLIISDITEMFAEEPDDLTVVITLRLNRREPYGVRWVTDPNPIETDLGLLYRALEAIMRASRASSQPVPERKM